MIGNPAAISTSYFRQWESAIASRRIWPIVRVLLTPLASLRLTVALFAMTLFLVWVGTVALQEKGIWEVVQTYFHAVVAWVELRDVFPRAFFRSRPGLYEALAPPGGFFFPGGITLGGALFVNLIAAHLVRFRAVAQGRRLALGIVVMILAIGLCVLVILNGQMARGLQGKPPVSWSTLWYLLLSASLLLWAATTAWLGYYVFVRQQGRFSFGTALGSGCCLLWGIGTVALLISGQVVSASSMRILWQLTQATVCGVALYLASRIIFGRRAGIVTLHMGIGLLMFGELLVSVAAVEEQMSIVEGQTVNYASDVRSVELAIVDTSGSDVDKVIAIPLTVKETPTRFLRSGRIRDPRLPFEIEILDYQDNADLVQARPGRNNPATAGLGLQYRIRPLKKSSGAQSGGMVDMAAAYVTVKDKKGEKIDTYLLSQLAAAQDIPETVTVEGKQYQLYLRFHRRYKPYSVTLIDVRKDDYIGTNTPKNYSSDVRIKAPAMSFDSELHISMNNPVRFAGETLYQSGYQADPRTGQESTTLQIVTNIGWMIPYVACGIVMVGMLTHFINVLLRFLERLGRTSERVGLSKVAARVSWRWLVAGVLLGVLMLGRTFIPPRTPDKQMQLERFSRLPAAYEGRIKPIDSIARNSLRFFSGREKIKLESKEKIAAIRWLTELLAGKPEAERYPIFKIDNRDVLHTLELKPRKGNRFSYQEMAPRMEEFRKQVRLAREAVSKDPETNNVYQRKIIELDGKLQRYFAIRRAFRLIDEPTTGDDAFAMFDRIARVADEVRTLKDAPIPYPVPAHRDGSEKTGERLWEPLIVASARIWINQVLRDSGQPTVEKFAATLTERLQADEARIERAARNQLVAAVRQMQQQQAGKPITREEAEKMLERMPAETRQAMERSFGERVRKNLGESRGMLERAIREIQGTSSDPVADRVAQTYADAFAAFRADNVKGFNLAVARLDQIIAESNAKDLHLNKVRFEAYYNHVSPFVNAIPAYIIALLIAMLGLFPKLNRAKWLAFGLLLATVVYHSWALGARIYISGRPPVTNLYSSAIFIAYLGVVLGIILEIVFRVGVGNIVAAVSGPFGLLIAHILNTTVAAHSGDTMKVMQAVLDTQFWLATHVLTVAAGYFATNVAGILGMGAVVCAMIGWWVRSGRGDRPTGAASEPQNTDTVIRVFNNVFKMTIYASICLGIFFSFVGTVLGGLWADDSWGRFWGWDPKENGALMIVLWNALVLHARWAGLVRERGLALLAIAGNLFLGWSWFGVNELGVGLHSYGFTEGVLLFLGLWWLFNLMIIGAGLLLPRRLYQGS